MKKVYILLFVLSLGMVFCSGCSNEMAGEEVIEKIKETTTDSVEGNFRQYQIQWKEFDKKLVCDVLLENFDESNIPPEQKNGTTIIEQGNRSLFLTSNGGLDYLDSQDAAYIGTLFFYYLFGELTNKEVDLHSEVKYLQDVELVQKAEEEISEIVGTEELHLNRACRLTREELADLEKALKEVEEGMETVGQWEAEEYIAVEYTLTKDNIIIMGIDEPQQPYVMDVWGAQAAYIQAVLGEGKILYLSMRGIIETTGEEEVVTLITKEEAVEIVKAAEANVVSGDTWKNQEIQLEYVPVPDWTASIPEPETLIPYWCIIRSNGEAESVIRINAVTGGNLAYGE